MATVGSLGDIVFKVSDSTIFTLNNLKFSGAARYSTHQRCNGNALTEFTGIDPDKITFEITLSAALGINPKKIIDKISKYERNGKILKFVLGGKVYGKYAWVIINHSASIINTDSRGQIAGAIISIGLQEYIKS